MGLVAILFLGYALQTEQIRREHDRHLPKAQSITIPIGVAIACNVYIFALLFAIFRPKNRPGAARLTIVLAGMTANPARRLSELPMLTAAENRQILETWNDTSLPDWP